MSLFKTTNWADVTLAGDRKSIEGMSAFARLIAHYSPALQNHLLHVRRLNATDAEDVLQQFVVDKLIERELLSRADQTRGKFRTFLLGLLDRFLIDWYRRNKRSDNAFEEWSRTTAPVTHLEVDAFERSWAESMMADALAKTCRFFEATGRPSYWELFQRRVVDPAYDQSDETDYHELVTQLGFANPRAASAAIITVKRALRRNLEALLGDTPEQSKLELDDLVVILSRGAIEGTSGRR